MRIRTTEMVEKEISFEKMCVYEKHDNMTKGFAYAATITNADGYISDSVHSNHSKEDIKFFAKFSVSEEREMASNEVHAYHFMKLLDNCTSICRCCVFNDDCPISPGRASACRSIMEGKEVIE